MTTLVVIGKCLLGEWVNGYFYLQTFASLIKKGIGQYFEYPGPRNAW